MRDKAQKVLDELQQVEKDLLDPNVYSDPGRAKTLGQKQKELSKKAAKAKTYLGLLGQIEEAKTILNEESDPEWVQMAKAEKEAAEHALPEAEENLRRALIVRDPNNEKNAIVEVRAGVGGDEASLFAAEITQMIMRYAQERDFTVEILSETENEAGGIKEMIFKVTGYGAYGALKFESGVHRVQRIPVTESQGRVHTSAISVVVYPEVEEAEFHINEADVRVDVFRSSGCGGQSVNTTDSAVRLTHLPTGMVVTCQDEKSQLKNKNKAFNVLRARLAAEEEARRQAELGQTRLAQIGSGDRSDKVRTYNFPQDRVTDHRIGQNFSNIEGIMAGSIGKIVEALALAEEAESVEGNTLS